LGRAALEKQRRFFVMVTDDEIVAGFCAAYCRRPHHPQLIVRRRTDTDDVEMIAQAWHWVQSAISQLADMQGSILDCGWIAAPGHSAQM
jgi:hypothetical protein